MKTQAIHFTDDLSFLGARWDPQHARVGFRVWAPERNRIQVVVESGALKGQELELGRREDGYFTGKGEGLEPGLLYRYRLDGGSELFPDPASRFQPEGPHGPSQVVDGRDFPWSDSEWKGPSPKRAVILEIHVGTFTPEGTWRAAQRRLPLLAEMGINVVELMPVADFAGEFGWGYDGVNLFAPTRLYGTPDDFRSFVNEAHRLGIAVILDVVYNHLGAEGNYLPHFSPYYISRKHQTDWGDAFNLDDTGCQPVRDYLTENARYWIQEFHLDGFRVDATQAIHDDSPEHILKRMVREVREYALPRRVLWVAENEPQEVDLVRSPSRGGYGMDSIWNDDFHHVAMVALTGNNEAYYSDYRGSAQEFVSLAKHGFLYQGQYYRWQKKRRGSPTRDVPSCAFVSFLQNHDQIANSIHGRRAHQISSPARYRALTALLIVLPGTPLLFQGQEFAASSPFLYFADREPSLRGTVRHGRRDFLRQFETIRLDESVRRLTDPCDRRTFERCRLDWAEWEEHRPQRLLVQDAIRLRGADPVFSRYCDCAIDGAVLGEGAFVVRVRGEAGEERLIVANLGRRLELDIVPEPLLAPPPECRWRMLWSSERHCYGGIGVVVPEGDAGWLLTADTVHVLKNVSDLGEAS